MSYFLSYLALMLISSNNVVKPSLSDSMWRLIILDFPTYNFSTIKLFYDTYHLQVALVEPLMCKLLYWEFDYIAYQFLGEEVGIAEVLQESDIWLLR